MSTIFLKGRKKDKKAPGHPTFLLYAGTSTPSVTEINGVKHGIEPPRKEELPYRWASREYHRKKRSGLTNGEKTSTMQELQLGLWYARKLVSAPQVSTET